MILTLAPWHVPIAVMLAVFSLALFLIAAFSEES